MQQSVRMLAAAAAATKQCIQDITPHKKDTIIICCCGIVHGAILCQETQLLPRHSLLFDPITNLQLTRLLLLSIRQLVLTISPS